MWTENFEESSVNELVARYEDAKPSGLSLDSDISSASSGAKSGKFTASPSNTATDLFKKLSPGHDELFIRYYAKYQSGVEWHHTGVWVGGYNPAVELPEPPGGPQTER